MLADLLFQLAAMTALLFSCSLQQCLEQKGNATDMHSAEETIYCAEDIELKCIPNKDSNSIILEGTEEEYFNATCCENKLNESCIQKLCSAKKEATALSREFINCTETSTNDTLCKILEVNIAACPTTPDSTEITSEKDSTEITSEKDSTEITSEKDSTEITSEKDSTEIASEKDSTEITSESSTTTNAPPSSSPTIPQSIIIAATLSIIILLLVAMVVLILLLYWRFRLKIQRERTSYNVNSGTADNAGGTNYLTALGDPLYSELDDPSNLLENKKPHLPNSGRPLPEQPGTNPAHLQQDIGPVPRYTEMDTQASEYEQPLQSIQQSSPPNWTSHDKTLDTQLMGNEEGSKGIAMRRHYPDDRDGANAQGSTEEDETNAQHMRDATMVAYDRIERVDSNTRRDDTNTYDRMERIDSKTRRDDSNAGDRIERVDDARRRDITNSYDRIERVDANKRRGDITNSYDRIDRTSSNTASKKQSLPKGFTSDTAISHDTMERTTTGNKNGDTINSNDTVEMTDIETQRNNSYNAVETTDTTKDQDTANSYDTVERVDTSNRQGGTAHSYDTVERVDTSNSQGGTAHSYDTVERVDTSNRQGGTAHSYDTVERVDTSNSQGGTTNSYDTVERVDTSNRQEGTANTVEKVDTKLPNLHRGAANENESNGNETTTAGAAESNGISSPNQPIESDYAKLSTEPTYAILEHP